MKSGTPLPRPSVADPALTRPNWVKGAPREKGPLWLDKNENCDPELLKVTHAVLNELDPLVLCTYPDTAPLYQKLAGLLDLPPEYLALSAGSDGAIRYTFEAYIDPGDSVVHTTPTFAMYPVYSQMYGAKVHTLAYEAGPEGPILTVESIKRKLKEVRPKLFCLPNPDSPTGHLFEDAAMREILDTARETNTIALIDEAYHPFHAFTAARWTLEYPNLVVARTFAKAWGLAGLRIGYAIACPELALYLHKVQPMYETNTLAIAFMEQMIDRYDAVLASVQRLNEGKNYFIGEMQRLGFRTLNNHGNFLHVNFGDHRPTVLSKLSGRVLFRANFSEPCLAGFSRFSSTTRAQFEPLVSVIKDAVPR